MSGGWHATRGSEPVAEAAECEVDKVLERELVFSVGPLVPALTCQGWETDRDVPFEDTSESAVRGSYEQMCAESAGRSVYTSENRLARTFPDGALDLQKVRSKLRVVLGEAVQLA